MKERGKGGSIVNISSVLSGKLEMTGRSIYSATKAAVQRISAAAAFELGQYKVQLSVLLVYLLVGLIGARLPSPNLS